jgi:hypothetical protein
MKLTGLVLGCASIWTLSNVIACGEKANDAPLAGAAGVSVEAGGDSGAAGGADAAAGSGGSGAAQTLAEELCGIKADGRMTCDGDYESYDSRAEYVTACVEQNPSFSCGHADPDSLRTLIACYAQCGDHTACVSDFFKAAGEAHPERGEALDACNALVDECYPSSPEARDGVAQDCLSYFAANDVGLKQLDACVASGCDGLSDCLDAAACR